MPPAVDRIYELARQTLDAVVERWDTDAEALPARQYVSNGLVMWDSCEQVAVQVERTFGIDGNIANEVIGGDGVPPSAMRAVGVVVWIIRCVHDIDAQGELIVYPTADEMEDDAVVLLADPTAITNAIVAAYKAGELGVCQGVALEGGQMQGPEGGYAGWAVRLRLALI